MVILDTYSTIVGHAGGPTLGFFLGLAITTFAAILIVVSLIHNDDAGAFVISFLLGIILMFAGWSLGKPLYQTQYAVTIDNTVALTEFLEDYDIVEQQGDLWIVRDKNVEPSETPTQEVIR